MCKTSDGLMLVDSINQSLAGRTELFMLHPLSYREITQHDLDNELNDLLFKGGFPKIYNEGLDPTRWHRNYFQLYVEKDIRQIANIKNIDLFERFIRLAAGRSGQPLNLSHLANEVGVTVPTIQQWTSALQTTFICFTLQPHHKNFNKRIIKSSKLYFFDTGLLCYLLGINDKQQLDVHPLRGNIFENFIVSESYKNQVNQAMHSNFYFWRDQKGHEVDLVTEHSGYLFAREIKSGKTFHPSLIKNIKFFNKLQSDNGKMPLENLGVLVYGGESKSKFKNIKIQNWQDYLKESTSIGPT